MKAILAICAAATIALFLAAEARGHGPAQWVADGGYKAANGGTCCGSDDCTVIYPIAVQWLPESVRFVVEINGEPVEMETAKAGVHVSKTVDFWMCVFRNGSVDELAQRKPRCLFIPTTAAH